MKPQTGTQNWLKPPNRQTVIADVKGRFIGEVVRSIIDVMDYTKEQNVPGILLFIDFEKAFDSLHWNFYAKMPECISLVLAAVSLDGLKHFIQIYLAVL